MGPETQFVILVTLFNALLTWACCLASRSRIIEQRDEEIRAAYKRAPLRTRAWLQHQTEQLPEPVEED